MSTLYVHTKDIKAAVSGREEEVLDGLGIPWQQGRPHIHCPYPDHSDEHPSWRWEPKSDRAFCTCIEKADSIFDVVIKTRGLDFGAAKLLMAEILGRRDIIRVKGGTTSKNQACQWADAASLLSPAWDNRDDSLPVKYLAHRLGVSTDAVPMPSTPTVGIRALGYFLPAEGKGQTVQVKGHYPAAVFGATDAAGRLHAMRIYLAPDGAGKADLDGLETKKAARTVKGESKAGCSVLWGEMAKAPHVVITEGIETAAAVALALNSEIEAGQVAVAAALSAVGIEAFTPWPRTTKATIAADRDEQTKPDGTPGSHRGEKAARTFGLRHHPKLSVVIAMPGHPGEVVDWLDVLLRDGIQVVRDGILSAQDFSLNAEEETAEQEAARWVAEDDHDILIREGRLAEAMDAAEVVLAQPDLPLRDRIFQRGGKLVRVGTLPAYGVTDGVQRPQEAVILIPVEKAFILTALSRHARFKKFDRRTNAWRLVDPPTKIAEMILANSGQWQMPALRGIVTSPTLRANGSLLLDHGYDARSGYFLAHDLKITVPEKPSQAEAVAALARLTDLLGGFVFVEPVDRAVAVSLILTALTRPALDQVPIIAITAPIRGSGKSTLVDITAVIVSGRRSAVLSATADGEELEKRLVSCLLAGDSIISIDNINGVLKSDLLCQATTSEAVKVRPLGSSTQAEIPNSALWSCNGNNLTLAGDLSRRALLCRLDPGIERPEERLFAFDPIIRARELRAEYVAAALTILRGYIVAGRPELGLTPFGSFERWSDLVRSALVWAGAADPCYSRLLVQEDDPETAQLRALLPAWFEQFGRSPTKVRELVKVTDNEESMLAEVLHEIAGEKYGINSKSLGKWLRRYAGRIIGGLKLNRCGGTKMAEWQVIPAA